MLGIQNRVSCDESNTDFMNRWSSIRLLHATSTGAMHQAIGINWLRALPWEQAFSGRRLFHPDQQDPQITLTFVDYFSAF